MMSRTVFVTTLVAALGSGLVAGVFLAFSSFVMDALGRLPAAQGIAAMQSINVTILPSSFIATFMAMAVVSVALGIGGLVTWNQPGSMWLIFGSAAYLVGVIGVTAVFNIPRNDALSAADPATAAAASLWSDYLSSWTAWNHVRTVASFASMLSFVLALVARRGA